MMCINKMSFEKYQNEVISEFYHINYEWTFP